MNSCIFRLLVALCLLWSPLAAAQGVIPVALAQQSDLNGRPLSGALLYIYQVGTVSTPQNAFQDFGLTMPYPWPLRADSLGRIPMFYLANGQVHARLTDATGVVQFDYPNMQVIGAASSGGGGGGGVDPSTVFGSGDFKWRPTTELLTGWVKANGQSIGAATCIGCTGRTNADTQSLYTYLWTNCTNAHCPVGGGRGATAIADFNALKPLTLPDLRGRSPFGLDDMGAAGAGRIATVVNKIIGGDNQNTPGAVGGEGAHVQLQTEMAAHGHTVTDPGHSHVFRFAAQIGGAGTGAIGFNSFGATSPACTVGQLDCAVQNVPTGITGANSTGSSIPANVVPPMMLGTWYIKL